jgi:hypothetical protein
MLAMPVEPIPPDDEGAEASKIISDMSEPPDAGGVMMRGKNRPATTGRFAEGATMNMLDRSFEPDRHAIAALRTIARAALVAVRNAGKSAPEPHEWRDDRAIDLVLRSPVAPTRLADTAALQAVRINFLPSLVPVSAAARVLDASLSLTFDGAFAVSVPSVSLPSAAFITEGEPIPVLQGTSTANTPLVPSKLACLVALTREMVDGANGEAVMTQVLKENIGASLDAAFFNANAAIANTSPAGILNGVAPIAATAAGPGAMVADISNLAEALAGVAGSGQMIIVAAPKQATAVKLTTVDPPPVYASAALPVGTVVAIVAESIASAIDAPVVSTSIQTTLHMSAPAAALVASPSTVAAPQRSIFQTDSLSLRLTMDASWTRRGAGVAWIQNCNWP